MTDTAHRLFLATDGNVGIGTTGPDEKLHISGNILTEAFNGTGGQLKGIYFRDNFGSTSGAAYNLSILADQFGVSGRDGGLSMNAYDGIRFVTGSNDASGERMRITAAGNVGIGTTGPNAKLDVAGSIATTGSLSFNRTTSDYQTINLNNSDGNDFYIDAYAGRLRFHESTPTNAERMTILAGGNVGIGTTSPQTKLHISSGHADPTSSYTGGVWIGDTSGYTNNGLEMGSAHSSPYGFWMQTKVDGGGAGTYPLNLQPIGGNVGIGTTAPSYKLHVVGQVAGNAAYVNTSDMRLKKDVAPIAYRLGTVMQLRPVSFNWKEQKEAWQKQHQIGLIAQEVEQVVPEVVSIADDPSHTRSLAYGALVPVLIKSVQELKVANDTLAKRVEELEAAQATKH